MGERRNRAGWVIELRDLRTGQRHLYTKEVPGREAAIMQARTEHYAEHGHGASVQTVARIRRPGRKGADA